MRGHCVGAGHGKSTVIGENAPSRDWAFSIRGAAFANNCVARGMKACGILRGHTSRWPSPRRGRSPESRIIGIDKGFSGLALCRQSGARPGCARRRGEPPRAVAMPLTIRRLRARQGRAHQPMTGRDSRIAAGLRDGRPAVTWRRRPSRCLGGLCVLPDVTPDLKRSVCPAGPAVRLSCPGAGGRPCGSML